MQRKHLLAISGISKKCETLIGNFRNASALSEIGILTLPSSFVSIQKGLSDKPLVKLTSLHTKKAAKVLSFILSVLYEA